MRKFILLYGLLLAAFNIVIAQTNQMKSWFIFPTKIDMPFGLNPSTSTLPGVAPNCSRLANGMYDNTQPQGKMLFYISDGNVYDYSGTLIGSIIPTPQGGEITIVPFGDNDNSTQQSCKRKYSIFSTAGGYVTQSTIALVHTVLDLNSLSLTSTEVDNLPFNKEFGCIAVGKANAVGSRFVYFMGASGSSGNDGRIDMLVLDKFGNVSAPTVILGPTLPPPNANIRTGYQLFSRELELSPDGKYLAWARFESQSGACCGGERYNSIEVDPSTGLMVANSFRTFDINPVLAGNSVGGFRGMEFYQTGNNTYRLFLGAGSDGIYYTDFPANNTFKKVLNSDAPSIYGNSQIELSFNGKMYVSTAGTGISNLGAFDPSVSVPPPSISLTGFPSLTLPQLPDCGWMGFPFFTLPDQIDGENYNNSLAMPIALPIPVTINSITENSGGTVTWSISAGNTNPWGITTAMNPAPDAQVINEIRVSGNTHLIISGMKIKFSENAKVIIEPGSTLTLQDGTVLTSNYKEDPCIAPYTWQGVEVWGGALNPSQIGNPLAVGKLVMNDATIEYAKCGARAQRYYANNQNSFRGGIITANPGATFINCNVGVEYLPYQNKFNNKEYRNQSTFNGVGFQCDKKYPFTTPPICALIDGCFGIPFGSCTFEIVNSQTLFPYPAYGIKALNSNFIISNGTLFSDLFHAIDVRRTSGTKTFSVLNSVFKNNQKGIYARNINNPDVRVITFELGNYSNGGLISQFGVFSINCSGLKFEENQFNLSIPNNSNVRKYGIYTNSCGPAPNEIYMNYFNNINYGNYAVGVNRDPAAPKTSGLEYICNINTGNVNFDFLIADGTVNGKGGIRLNQGSSSISAGNTFSILSPNGSFSDFNNLTSMNVSYYYDLNKIPHNFNGITPATTFTITPNTCLSHICDPPCNVTIRQTTP